MDIPQIIARNITTLRKNAGMTQAGLAEKIGYSDKSISKWERAEGIPDVICLKAIADLFGVSVDYMLTEEHNVPVQQQPEQPEPPTPPARPQQ
ncbi:MAG: helix-turn-helix transcriptional regulator, partial [Clostridia bacterium]|nr:helix-turn-helix transcriptional regulator [Clostridia bacterium]